MSGRLQTAQNQRQIENSQMQESLLQILNGRELLKKLSKRTVWYATIQRRLSSFLRHSIRWGCNKLKQLCWDFRWGSFLTFAILGIELLFVGFKVITIGQFAAFSMLTPSFTWLFYSMPSQYAELTRNLVSAKRLLPLINRCIRSWQVGQSRQKPS